MTGPEFAKLASIIQADAGLRVEWTDGQTSLFHYLWLRDCCYCDACGDCLSSLRRYVPDLATLALRPGSVSWDEDTLQVEWEGDHHRSSYAAEWLYTHRYDDVARSERRPAIAHWDASTNIDDIAFRYADVVGCSERKLALQQRLLDYGIVLIRGGPTDAGAVTRFAGLFGEVAESAYGSVFDLKPDNSVGTAGTTLRAVPPHSDEAFAYTPPGIETLACVRPAESGGDSVLVDGFGIANRLRNEHPASFDSLARWNHSYIRLHPGKLDQRASMPVIALDDDGEISGIRLHTRASAPLDLPSNVMEDYLMAYHRLCTLMMLPENQLQIRLQSGDAVVFDNHRALHARTEFSDRRRFLQICGVTREKFHESYRLLATQLGDMRAANRVLRAGACR